MSETIVASSIGMTTKKGPNLKRYFQFSLLLLAGGAIYPLLYLRQNFETTVLAAFHISTVDLGHYYALLGIVYALSYLPSGWLADKLSPRLLIVLSLSTVGLLGLWFSTYPSKAMLNIIFLGWGLSAGLTFWAALIKGVKLLASSSEQGRFFGILDGGRGLVEAILATIAVSIFIYMSNHSATPQQSLRPIIYLYSLTCLVMGLLIFIFFSGKHDTTATPDSAKDSPALLASLTLLFKNRRLWLLVVIIFTGYQLFWATYSFSAYLQHGYGLTAVTAGIITVTKLWTRPVGGVVAGFLGDKFSPGNILVVSMLLASLGLLVLIAAPATINLYLLQVIVLFIGVMVYAVRGLYWAILDVCSVPASAVGLAIGLVSVIGYLPDVFLPMLNSAISNIYPGTLGTKIYFGYIATCGVVGAMAALYLTNISKVKEVKA